MCVPQLLRWRIWDGEQAVTSSRWLCKPTRLQLGRPVLPASLTEPHHEVFRTQRHRLGLFLLLVLALSFLMFVVAKLACVAVSASPTGEEAASLTSALCVRL